MWLLLYGEIFRLLHLSEHEMNVGEARSNVWELPILCDNVQNSQKENKYIKQKMVEQNVIANIDNCLSQALVVIVARSKLGSSTYRSIHKYFERYAK